MEPARTQQLEIAELNPQRASSSRDFLCRIRYLCWNLTNIDKHYRTGEGNEEQISVVGRIEPGNGSWEYGVPIADGQLWNAFHNCPYGKFPNMESPLP